MDKRVAPDKEGAMDKQCLGEGKPGQVELAKPFQAHPSRRRKTLIPNRGPLDTCLAFSGKSR